MSGDNKVVSAAEYRKKIGEARTITCPSGMCFEVRVLSSMDYIEAGLDDLPNEFLGFIAELAAGTVKDTTTKEAQKNFDLFEKFLKITVELGIKNPSVVMVYDKEKGKDFYKETLLYHELNKDDQKYLVDVITGTISV